MQWFNTRLNGKRKEVFDPVRKKYVLLSPEEEVRQITLHYLIEEKEVPAGLVSVEYSMKLNKLVKRCDIVVFARDGKPLMIVECKARHITLNQAVLDQATRYNMNLNVRFLLLTNGLNQICVQYNFHDNNIIFLDHIPQYASMLNEDETK